MFLDAELTEHRLNAAESLLVTLPRRELAGKKRTMSGVDASRPINMGRYEVGLTLSRQVPFGFLLPARHRLPEQPPFQWRSSGRDLASPGNATNIQHHHHHPPSSAVLRYTTSSTPRCYGARYLPLSTSSGLPASRFGRLRPGCLLSVVLILRSSPLRPHSALRRHASPVRSARKACRRGEVQIALQVLDAPAAADTRKHENQAEGSENSTWPFHRQHHFSQTHFLIRPWPRC